MLFVFVDIDECIVRIKCQCLDCKCINKWGGYDCECLNDLFYIYEYDICISKYFFLYYMFGSLFEFKLDICLCK